MIALHSDCILLETDHGECTPVFPEDVSQEMLGIHADPDYFEGAVGAVFAYIHQKQYRSKVSLERLSDLVSMAMITPPGKLTRHIWLPELMQAESLLGELEFFANLKEILQSLEEHKRGADLCRRDPELCPELSSPSALEQTAETVRGIRC